MFLSRTMTSASMPWAIQAAFIPAIPGPDHDDLRRAHAGDAAEEHAAAPVLPLEERGADLGRHPTRDLAHRREQRKRSIGELDGLVRDRRPSSSRSVLS